MTHPTRYLNRMLLFLVLVLIVTGLLYGPLYRAFLANPLLNGLIFVVLLFGLAYVFRQVLMLRSEVNWIESFRRSDPAISVVPRPNLLAPVATMLSERQGAISLSATAARSLLDSISARLEEGREISRYLIGLLVFLGLLGTFWGLLQTVSAVGNTIATLSPSGDDFVAFFNDLQAGLQAPLSGMGIAFSSSLFGLAGSLVLGFLELQAGQAQGRFYMDFENWLSNHTRLGAGGLGVDADHSVPAYIQALLEQNADNLENLGRIIQQSEEGRASGQAAIMRLAERLAELTERMGAEQDVLRRLADSTAAGQGGFDDATRNHLRSLDLHVTRLLEETTQGRNQLIGELRSEIKLLARTIAALGDDRR